MYLYPYRYSTGILYTILRLHEKYTEFQYGTSEPRTHPPGCRYKVAPVQQDGTQGIATGGVKADDQQESTKSALHVAPAPAHGRLGAAMPEALLVPSPTSRSTESPRLSVWVPRGPSPVVSFAMSGCSACAGLPSPDTLAHSSGAGMCQLLR